MLCPCSAQPPHIRPLATSNQLQPAFLMDSRLIIDKNMDRAFVPRALCQVEKIMDQISLCIFLAILDSPIAPLRYLSTRNSFFLGKWGTRH
jgi:hypothetical protein